MRCNGKHRRRLAGKLDAGCNELCPNRKAEAQNDLKTNSNFLPSQLPHKGVHHAVQKWSANHNGDRVSEAKEVAAVLEALEGEVRVVLTRVHLASLGLEDAGDGALQNPEEEIAHQQQRHAIQTSSDIAFWKPGRVLQVGDHQRPDASNGHSHCTSLQGRRLDESVHNADEDEDGNEHPAKNGQLSPHGATALSQCLNEQLNHRLLLHVLLSCLAIARLAADKEQECHEHQARRDHPGKEVAVLNIHTDARDSAGRPTREERVGQSAA
mmetsp:Transcript_13907/g.33054  ORF Transcript_13907/g.33054 Transcript_13907/m.33054 type:complete len:268 (-) Transcript_13907:513-1316(-)